MSDIEDVMGTTPSAAKKAKPGKVTNKATKPSKAITIKPGPTPKAAKPAAKAEKPAKAAKPAAKAEKPAKAKKAEDDVSTLQPDDSVVLKAVRKLKGPTMASQFAADLGVHRRVIRAQLQRLAKEKTNGVSMKKDGANWYVANTAK